MKTNVVAGKKEDFLLIPEPYHVVVRKGLSQAPITWPLFFLDFFGCCPRGGSLSVSGIKGLARRTRKCGGHALDYGPWAIGREAPCGWDIGSFRNRRLGPFLELYVAFGCEMWLFIVRYCLLAFWL